MTVMEPATRLFNRSEYFKMADIGLFDGQRVELIGGEIVYMSPQNNPHAVAISKILQWLGPNLNSHRYTLRCQAPMTINTRTVPEPDFAIIAGPADALKNHPKSALFVMEVSDTTLRHDRMKASIYASALVPEYWLLNLRKRELEVYRMPEPADELPFGAKYAELKTYASHDLVKVKNVALPAVKVKDLMAAAV